MGGMAGEIITILNYLGVTHDRALPFLLLIIAMVIVNDVFTAPIKTSLIRIKNAIIEMQTIAVQEGIAIRHHLVETAGSPVAPTEYGRQLIVESGLEQILNKYAVYLRERLDAKIIATRTKYDVQEAARALLIELKRDKIMNPVKQYAFDQGIDVDVILKAGGLWLRDDFLGRQRTVHTIESA